MREVCWLWALEIRFNNALRNLLQGTNIANVLVYSIWLWSENPEAWAHFHWVVLWDERLKFIWHSAAGVHFGGLLVSVRFASILNYCCITLIFLHLIANKAFFHWSFFFSSLFPVLTHWWTYNSPQKMMPWTVWNHSLSKTRLSLEI